VRGDEIEIKREYGRKMKNSKMKLFRNFEKQYKGKSK
jgi:hypothetical protein